MNEGIRKAVAIKLKPSIVKKARIGDVLSDKRLGQWVEEAIEEKQLR